MRGILGACAVFYGFLTLPEAEASVRINIDLSSQTVHVRSESGSYDWPVSTARFGYRTPRGTYRPSALQRMHYSRKYHMSPMPHSIFFAGGYAIHGTYETRWLGRPASHGCIRLSPGNAAYLFQMVKAEGALIAITGTPPHAAYAQLHRKRSYSAAWHRNYDPLAYAPARRAPAVRAWQANPIVKPVPEWPDWP